MNTFEDDYDPAH
jgi:hypothetical protein